MVRAGAVAHPTDWKWCSTRELTGLRQRYRLVDRDRLGAAVGRHPDSPEFRSVFLECIDRRIAEDRRDLEPVWTEGLAVGSEEYVGQIAQQASNRIRFEVQPVDATLSTAWVLRESAAGYA